MESSTDVSPSGAMGPTGQLQQPKRDASLPSHAAPPTKKAKTTTMKSNASCQRQPKLPAEVIGSVFDFMPCGEVRSALLAGKFVATEAVKHVRTINIMAPSQMNVPAIRRFPNVEEVNILCLLSPHDVDDERVDRDIVMHANSISPEVVGRTPSFLVHVTKLRRIFVGGPTGLMRNCGYHHRYCIEPRDHATIFRGLLEGCAAAFKNKAFPSTLTNLRGISDRIIYFGLGKCVGDNPIGCTLCRDLCDNFPMEDVVRFFFAPRATCLDTGKVVDAIKCREGGKMFLEENSADILLRVLRPLRHSFFFDDRNRHHLDYSRKMSGLSVYPIQMHEATFFSIKFLTEKCFENLSELIKNGFDPRKVSRDQLRRKMLLDTYEEDEDAIRNRLHCIWAKGALAVLINLGFDISLEDEAFLIIDEKAEPVFRESGFDTTYSSIEF